MKQGMFKSSKADGFTLLEVLVAVLVFSFGLLGIAGLMTISVRNNHNGYLRSQANFLAENMVDRMRANPVALWAGTYAGTPAQGTFDCTLGSPCGFNQLATYDMQEWANSLAQALPNGAGNINCQALGALPSSLVTAQAPSIWSPVPPYDGVCTVTVSWQESTREGFEPQEVVLVVQP